MSAELHQALLKLSVQGIFLFARDMVIQDPVSEECRRLFGADIRGMDAGELLFGAGAASDEFRQGLDLVFAGQTLPEVVFDLLEKEIVRDDRKLRLDYAFLDASQVLVTATDITRERRFQEISRRDLERRFAVLKAVSHRGYFSAFTHEAHKLFDDLTLYEGGLPSADSLEELGRQVHTLKGNAGFFDFPDTVTSCHALETHLEELRILGGKNRIKESSIILKQAYFSELRKITDVLGERWLTEADCISVPKKDYRLIEAWVVKEHPGDRRLLTTLARYRREPFRELFVRFPEMAANLAIRLGKRLHPLMVEGGDFPVMPERYRSLTNVLVHLVRNALDHGIETPAEREKAGKLATGSLRISLDHSAGQVRVSISDDGRGLDPIAIRQKADSMGMMLPDQSAASLMQILFHQGFSTLETATEISGRGIGLSAVKAEIDRLGGSIQIHSRPGRGTTFEISIPETRKPAAAAAGAASNEKKPTRASDEGAS